MTLNGFIDKYNGRYVDYDGKYGAQCVDLIRQYLKEVLGIDGYSLPPVSYAKELYKNFVLNKNFVRIKNTPSFIPQKGDIIVWDWRFPVTGYPGHVAIFIEGDVNRFIAFGQNYGKPNFCKFTNYDYRGVLGVLRKV